MELSFPLVNFYFIKFYYYVPNLMYSSFPIAADRVGNFENLAPIST